MRNSLKRRIGGEEGKVLVLVLAMLVIGGLVLAPLLGLGSTGLAAGRVYERKAAELYAADAGVEDGIWKLQNPDVSQLPHQTCADKTWSSNYTMAEVNGKDVFVQIDYLGNGLFKITSTASENGSSTTILSWLQGDYLEYDIKVEDGDEPLEGIKAQTVYAEGDLIVEGNIEGDAVVYAAGDLEVSGNIEDGAYVHVLGDLILAEGFSNIENQVIICVGGSVVMQGERAEVLDNVQMFVEGDLSAKAIQDGADVCVEGQITVVKIETTSKGTPYVCAGADLGVEDKVLGGDLRVGGMVTVGSTNTPTSIDTFDNCILCSESCPECRICCECPLIFGRTDRVVKQVDWIGWRVTTYLINPEQ